MTIGVRTVVLPALLLLATGAVARTGPGNAALSPGDEMLDANVSAPLATAAVSTPAWLTPAITAAAGLCGALIGGYFATRNAKAAIVQKTNELEIEAIDTRIGDFIAPFQQLSLENLKLSRELKLRHGGDAFRTLPALLDPSWLQALSPGDKTLVDAVVANGSALREMILAHGGAVPAAIRPHVAAASMHFRMLALAYAGGLDPDPSRYVAYVYPRQLDKVLELERARLESRRELLRSLPDVSHPAIQDLAIPPELEV